MAICSENVLAKALYDNKAESSDELTFRRGDILMVLEQSILGSEGWWKCSLLGRKGLAPANRLQVLPSSPSEGCPIYTPRSPNHCGIYQVPSTSKISPSSEDMKSLYQAPSPSSVLPKDIYQVPISSVARVFTDQTYISTNQHLFTLPKASQASLPISAACRYSELYDVPSPQRPESLVTQSGAIPPMTRKFSQPFTASEHLQLQQLYDIPSSSEKLRVYRQQNSPMACDVSTTQISRHISQKDAQGDAPSPTEVQNFTGHFNTLPNPQKSEWIYDLPVSPEKPVIKQVCENPSPEKRVLYDIPPIKYGSGLHDVLSSKAEDRCNRTQIYDVPPVHGKLTFSDQPLYDVPTSRDMPLLKQNGIYDIPPAQRAEHWDSKNIYNIPKDSPPISQHRYYNERSNNTYKDPTYDTPPPLPRDPKPPSRTPEQDRLSVTSVDSRASSLSTSSTASSESFSPEESAKEIVLELDIAIEKLSQLQHRVASSIASLMIHVSSRWRSEEHLGANIDDIHRAVDGIKESLAEFLEFAEGVKGNAAHLRNATLQARISKQLQILTDSFQILQETREALNKCNWLLSVLVITKPQSNSDDLDRFVMVARTIPEDIKCFVSIIIANGKLLFRQKDRQENKKSKMIADDETELCMQVPKRTDPGMVQRSAPSHKLDENKGKPYCLRRNATENCVCVQLQASSAPMIKKSKEGSTARHSLSDHARLYFGALQKAIDVFNSSLSNKQPPETFITQSKLIIMVGQKLVDTLCQDVQGNDTRNEILHASSQLCGLLKNLALATKTAAVQYPNLKAMQDLQEQANALLTKTQQFRAMMEQ
uniref:Cas scaffolding protein family member 4 isoform X2 n=1 Tax=Geotrypetes seraphini TaxID=260995 RepID=A0A6P8SWD1_GEOSA|nr:cas scaffolding protein family member 4 isoform X2 [Geotrypetes seraphini]